MANGKDGKKQVNAMANASEELSKLLIKLYKSKSFTHAGKSLADMLFKSGIEAGALISGIGELTERTAKISAANQAILKLNKTKYLASVMEMADFYRAGQVKPIISYIKQIIEGLRELLLSVPEPVKKIRVQSAQAVFQPVAQTVAEQPAVASAPVAAVAEEQAQLSAPAQVEEAPATVALQEEDDGNRQLTIDLGEEDALPLLDDDEGFNEPMPLIG
jgi:hypothetical protein